MGVVMSMPLPFKLARFAHGKRNLMDTGEEISLQAEAQQRREVCMPGVDLATAWAMVRSARKLKIKQREPIIRMKQMTSTDLGFVEANYDRAQTAKELQIGADTARVSVGYCVFIHESWSKMPHLVRYFELVERNEAPDSPLLEWLIMVGAVHTEAAKATAGHFRNVTRVGRTFFVLCEEDLARINMAVDVRLQLEAEEEAARRTAAAEDAKVGPQ